LFFFVVVQNIFLTSSRISAYFRILEFSNFEFRICNAHIDHKVPSLRRKQRLAVAFATNNILLLSHNNTKLLGKRHKKQGKSNLLPTWQIPQLGTNSSTLMPNTKAIEALQCIRVTDFFKYY
jgi:hypothetical protein